ncbi:GntR family transcriptional regulator, partial [Streptococcus suis]|uniref:GntR family transcriptional regulator n=1 Tax=Streptococcus suis TaxID=1307 RepID=UPI00215C3281
MVSQTVEKPLYLQLVDELEVAIRERMAPNDKLFSERELTQVYGVSRITVRLALQELEKRGLVYKKHGKGTYVSEISDTAVDLSQAYSFTEQMKKIGKVPSNVIKLTNLSHFVVGYFLCYTKNKRGKVMLDQIKAHLLDSIND